MGRFFGQKEPSLKVRSDKKNRPQKFGELLNFVHAYTAVVQGKEKFVIAVADNI